MDTSNQESLYEYRQIINKLHLLSEEQLGDLAFRCDVKLWEKAGHGEKSHNEEESTNSGKTNSK